MKKWNTYISHLRSVFCIILACNHQVIALNINKNIIQLQQFNINTHKNNNCSDCRFTAQQVKNNDDCFFLA